MSNRLGVNPEDSMIFVNSNLSELIDSLRSNDE